MTPTLTAPLAPFVDALPVPRRLIAGERDGRLTVRMRAAAHRFHRDLPESQIWTTDHVMGVPRYEVYAGLEGLWIIRDEREQELELPEGPPFELPLLIQDRNFDLDEQGRLTGRLVHKTDPEVMEAFAPFTVVNGKVWPALEVRPATYRFRVLNGSKARTYLLH